MKNNFRRALTLSVSLACVAMLGACGNMSMNGRAGASATLAPTAAVSPNTVAGTVTFTALEHGVRVAGEVRGLKPGSEHGFHIHEKGDCGDNGNAAGGHFNPSGGKHGKYGSAGGHAGDMPSLVADSSGAARFSVDDHSISLTEGTPNNIVGRALVVHRDPDDFSSQPAGNSGPRVACAVIVRK
ncbi:superoxide dismutase family protein [Variovorax dokdonensis]|uniref:Superoxide dismutase [Cu-Zn] n=1 Tax=Variovorax dokdonensis TaxID=344883 RepID=A0ABT7N7H0_9BURK|nr:superoxide dismutase family protein [Variovorax dokdonensis]MDM0043889.1 superoxide dismutase family protein [Variovorax dokdonensis]